MPSTHTEESVEFPQRNDAASGVQLLSQALHSRRCPSAAWPVAQKSAGPGVPRAAWWSANVQVSHSFAVLPPPPPHADNKRTPSSTTYFSICTALLGAAVTHVSCSDGVRLPAICGSPLLVRV